MKSRGILVFAAAGNQGVAMVCYPAAHPSVIAVGASQPTVASEDAGRAAYANYGTSLDLEVPGGAFEDVDGDGRKDAILARPSTRHPAILECLRRPEPPAPRLRPAA
jgi:subtilisin family serine protease